MLGIKLKELRIEKRVTQSGIAKALNVTRQAVGQWENDQREPDIINLKKLAKLFDITTDELLEYFDV